jgi:hypothetical protein
VTPNFYTYDASKIKVGQMRQGEFWHCAVQLNQPSSSVQCSAVQCSAVQCSVRRWASCPRDTSASLWNSTVSIQRNIFQYPASTQCPVPSTL